MELFTVFGMLTHSRWRCLKGVNTPCITVLYLTLKFHKAFLIHTLTVLYGK